MTFNLVFLMGLSHTLSIFWSHLCVPHVGRFWWSGYPSQLANCPLVAEPGSFQSSEIFFRSLSFGDFFLMLKIPFIKTNWNHSDIASWHYDVLLMRNFDSNKVEFQQRLSYIWHHFTTFLLVEPNRKTPIISGIAPRLNELISLL